MNPMSDKRDELRLLVNSRHPLIAVETSEEARIEELLCDVAAELDVPLFTWSVTHGLQRKGTDQAIYETEDPEKMLGNIANMRGDGIYLLKDFARYLDQDRLLRRLRELAASFREVRRSIVLSAPVLKLPPELDDDVAAFRIELPDGVLLLKVVQATIAEFGAQAHVKVELDQSGLKQLAQNLSGLTMDEARRTLAKCILERNKLDARTVSDVLEAKRNSLRQEGTLTYLKAESNFADVAGLKNLKEWLRKRRGALTPEGLKFGLEPPKGVLITGVQGCGKSLCAKAVAGEWSLQLARFDAGSLYDKFIGESEKRLRKSLEIAEKLAPLVLWIDEIEKGFAATGSSADVDAGLTQRILATFLTWLQDRQPGVFLVATSNNISALPPELLRKGRFDEIFFVDLPDAEARAELFKIHLKRRGRDPAAFNLAALASASRGFRARRWSRASRARCTRRFQSSSSFRRRFWWPNATPRGRFR
ncbi:MAG: AAA family ATPase [Acidobacteria bacterium]|nr:AAA family ATPase [Acidobacteriota bacterium]MBI3663755.1 AAA family ATPase [Acidobacteriota bacterium]